MAYLMDLDTQMRLRETRVNMDKAESLKLDLLRSNVKSLKNPKWGASDVVKYANIMFDYMHIVSEMIEDLIANSEIIKREV